MLTLAKMCYLYRAHTADGEFFMARVTPDEQRLRQRVFIQALVEWGTVRKACEMTNVPRRTYYDWRNNPDFVEKVDAAFAEYGDFLQETMFERIKNPTKGIGTDTLLIFALQGEKPETYRPQIMVEQDTAKKLMSEWFKTRQEEKRNTDVETTEELSEPIERTLEEVLQRRQGYDSGNADSGEEEEA